MKKYMSILLCLTVIALMGCQAVPEKQSVISNNEELFEHAIYEKRAEGQLLDSHIQYSSLFASTDNSVQFSFNVNQGISTEKIPVVKVQAKHIDSEICKHVAEVLLGNSAFYEREPSSNPRYSKAQYQEMINRLSPYSSLTAATDLVGIDSAEEVSESIRNVIATATELLEDAPEENPHRLCDWQLKKEREYNDSEWDILGRNLEDDNDWLVAVTEVQDVAYKYMVVTRDRDDYRLNRFIVQLGGDTLAPDLDRLVYWSELCRTEEPTEQEIQKIEELVHSKLQEMDMGCWSIASSTVEVYGTEHSPEYMIRVLAVPEFNEVSAIAKQKNAAKSEDYTGAYVLTQASFLMSTKGDLIEMRLDSPIEINEIINNDVATLSLEALLNRAQQHLSLSDASNYGMLMSERTQDIICRVNINNLECGLARIMKKNDAAFYYYVPAIMLYGDIEYSDKSTADVYYAATNENIICINAIDGSIIS